jgi:drug/metabolite transporter (DMT)-like permease
MDTSRQKTSVLTLLALIAFAGNSVLARLALVDGAIDAWSFTAIRLFSGAFVLSLLVGQGVWRQTPWHLVSWLGAVPLLGYAALFSFAYLSIDTGMGALLLFGAVQVTMIGWGIWRGEKLSLWQWLGIIAALLGLIGLLLPGTARPALWAAGVMLVSGICWGVYSLLGRVSAQRPLLMTAGNFVKASLLALPLSLWFLFASSPVQISLYGVGLAIFSGGITSGLGYAIWYRALKNLSASSAGIIQLAVPPLAALFGIVLLGETLTIRFVMASLLILAGIGLALRK